MWPRAYWSGTYWTRTYWPDGNSAVLGPGPVIFVVACADYQPGAVSAATRQMGVVACGDYEDDQCLDSTP